VTKRRCWATWWIVAVVSVAAMAGAEQQGMDQAARDDGERKLDFFVGEWTTADRTEAGSFGPGGASSGEATYGWEIGGRWLGFHFRTELPGFGPYEVRGGVSYDATRGLYRAYSVNSMGNLTVYDGRWEGEERLIFELVHPRVDPDQRVSYVKEPDGTVRMISEWPAQGGGRERYFETVLTRREGDDPEP